MWRGFTLQSGYVLTSKSDYAVSIQQQTSTELKGDGDPQFHLIPKAQIPAGGIEL